MPEKPNQLNSLLNKGKDYVASAVTGGASDVYKFIKKHKKEILLGLLATTALIATLIMAIAGMGGSTGRGGTVPPAQAANPADPVMSSLIKQLTAHVDPKMTVADFVKTLPTLETDIRNLKEHLDKIPETSLSNDKKQQINEKYNQLLALIQQIKDPNLTDDKGRDLMVQINTVLGSMGKILGGNRQAVTDLARQLVDLNSANHYPYNYGSVWSPSVFPPKPGSPVDCAAFTSYILQRLGLQKNKLATSGYPNDTQEMTAVVPPFKNEAEFWTAYNNKTITLLSGYIIGSSGDHVVIYIGNDDFAQSSPNKGGSGPSGPNIKHGHVSIASKGGKVYVLDPIGLSK